MEGGVFLNPNTYDFGFDITIDTTYDVLINDKK